MAPRSSALRLRPLLLLLLLALLLTGCLNPAMTIDARSALEQELTRSAIARAVERQAIHRSVLEDTWNIQVSAPDARDRDWIESCLRDRLVALGAKISDEYGADLPTVEARVVSAGADVDNFYIGLPVNFSGGYQMLSLYQSITQYGRARMSLTFRNADDTLAERTPEVRARVHFTAMYFLTLIGPFSTTDLGDRTWGRFIELGQDEWRQVRESADWIVPPLDESDAKLRR